MTSLADPLQRISQFEALRLYSTFDGTVIMPWPSAAGGYATLAVVQEPERATGLLVPLALSDADQALLYQHAAIAKEMLAQHYALTATQQTMQHARELLELSSDYVCCSRFVDNTLMFEWATPTFQHVTGYAPDELGIYGLWTKLFHPDDIPTVIAHHQLVHDGYQSITEFRIYTKHQQLRWIREHSIPFFHEDGSVTHILSAATNITHERMSDNQRHYNEATQRFQSYILDTVEQGIIATDSDGKVRYWNAYAEQMYGWSQAEAYGQPIAALIGIGVAAIPRYSEGSSQTWTLELTARHKNGHPLLIAAAFTPYGEADETERGILCITTDVTTLRTVREELAESERRYRFITEHMLDMVALFDVSLRFQYISPSICDVTGYSAAELMHNQAFDFIHPEDISELQELTHSITTHRISEAHVLFRYRHASGEWRWCEAAAKLSRWNGAPAIVANGRDITEQRALELRLAQNQRMDSIALLAGGIAHDFNNMLAVIIGYADLIAADLPADAPFINDLDAIRDAARRGATLTAQLLTFARRQILDPRPAHLNHIVQDMRLLIQQLLGPTHTLHFLLDENIPLIIADVAQIEQIIINLVLNARDALRTPGHLTIQTSFVNDCAQQRLPYTMLAKECVMLSISDTGAGIPKEIQQRIFDPFFTTKEQGNGNGLGLATCYGIIQQHGGAVNVWSEQGKGTRIDIRLPSVQRNHHPSASLLSSAPRPGTILIIEDMLATRLLYTAMLELAGYTIFGMVSSADGLDRFADTTPIDAVVVALTRQVESVALIWRIHERYAAIPMIILDHDSGYADGLPNTGVMLCIAAPPTLDSLVETVQRALTLSTNRHTGVHRER